MTFDALGVKYMPNLTCRIVEGWMWNPCMAVPFSTNTWAGFDACTKWTGRDAFRMWPMVAP